VIAIATLTTVIVAVAVGGAVYFTKKGE